MKNVSRFRNYLRNFVQFCFVGYNVKIPSVEQGPGSTPTMLRVGPWIHPFHAERRAQDPATPSMLSYGPWIYSFHAESVGPQIHPFTLEHRVLDDPTAFILREGPCRFPAEELGPQSTLSMLKKGPRFTFSMLRNGPQINLFFNKSRAMDPPFPR